MPPGHDPIPSAHTSVPGLGSSCSPVNTMSRKTMPCTKTSNCGSPPSRTSASGSNVWGGTSPSWTGRDASARMVVMRLAILGGWGFRVPLVYGALLRDHSPGRVTEVVLHDPDAGRLAAVALVLEQLGTRHTDPPRLVTTDDLDTALHGADFVFSAIRV